MRNLRKIGGVVFSKELESILSESDEKINRMMLERFLSEKEISQMVADLLKEKEWEILKIAVMAIFIEQKDEILLPLLFESVSNFIYGNDEDVALIQKTLTEAFAKASRAQLRRGIKLLNQFEELTILTDEVIPSLFFKKLRIDIKRSRFATVSTISHFLQKQLEAEAKHDLIDLSALIKNASTLKELTFQVLYMLDNHNYKSLKYLSGLIVIRNDKTLLEELLKIMANYNYLNIHQLESAISAVADEVFWYSTREQHLFLENILDKLKETAIEERNVSEGQVYQALNYLVHCESIDTSRF